MNTRRKHMARLLACIILCAFLIIGCKRQEQQPEPNREPKTFFGKSVDQAKKVSKSVSSHDEALRRQAEQLGE